MKKRVNISLAEDTVERLKQFAYENHRSVSQAVTDWVWEAPVAYGSLQNQSKIELKKKKEE